MIKERKYVEIFVWFFRERQLNGNEEETTQQQRDIVNNIYFPDYQTVHQIHSIMILHHNTILGEIKGIF